MKSDMKKILLTIVALLCIVGSLAKGKEVVWEKPTTEYGNVYGDGYFNIAMDVNRVDLKETETTVSVTVSLRSDYDNFKFQFASGTYLLAEGKRYALVSADGIELDKFVKTNADNKTFVSIDGSLYFRESGKLVIDSEYHGKRYE